MRLTGFFSRLNIMKVQQKNVLMSAKSAAFYFLCLQGKELAQGRNMGFLAKLHPAWVCSWDELSAPQAMATA